jgi:hypothetical protein
MDRQCCIPDPYRLGHGRVSGQFGQSGLEDIPPDQALALLVVPDLVVQQQPPLKVVVQHHHLRPEHAGKENSMVKNKWENFV